MGNGRDGGDIGHVRVLFTEGSVAGLTDAQLLERFTAQEGEAAQAAFAAIVERHGPMVLRVCGSVLRDRHEAEDAFQATFLVLARRARSLWVRGSLGPWLHQAAYRVALSARSAAARRRRHEQRAAELGASVAAEVQHDDQGEVIHEEVDRLPAGCRSAVVLCYFQGLSPEQAARVLECPVGTVQSRLARGRERLRSRLTRRGLGAAVGTLMGASPPPAPSALLADAAVRAASPLSGAAASASAVRIAEGVLRTMFLTKIRTAALALVATAALAAAGAQALLQEPAAPTPPIKPTAVRTAPGPPPDGRRPGADSPPPPLELAWNDLPQAEAVRVLENLSAVTRANHDKITTWKGTYSFLLKQDPFGSVKVGETREFVDSVFRFAVDAGKEALYRDIEIRRTGFLKAGANELKGPAAPTPWGVDRRSVITPEFQLIFRPRVRTTSNAMENVPDVRATLKVMGHVPEARDARWVDRLPPLPRPLEFPREEPGTDPRGYFKTDRTTWFWTELDRLAEAMKEGAAGRSKDPSASRPTLSKADGPGGTWYRTRCSTLAPGRTHESRLWRTTIWSPQAGYNPVSQIAEPDTPGAKDQGRKEWRWESIDGVFIPSWVKESHPDLLNGGPGREWESTLTECVLNPPLDPHQFDEFGLGVVDGDLVLNYQEHVGYIVRNGAIVKLADFGERPVPKPAASEKEPAASKAGPIYTPYENRRPGDRKPSPPVDDARP